MFLQTDKSGCATQTVDLADFALDQNGFEDNFEVTADLEEFGTGTATSTLLLPND